jgi:glycosyltransferase involved in cell wall biosynthesis
MTKTCINATNLHHGGGVQVATSFILDLLDSGVEEGDYDFYVSDIVCQNLPKKLRKRVMVRNTFGIRSILFNTYLSFKYSTIFTIFGPFYSFFKASQSIVGFAQPWIVFGNISLYKKYHGIWWPLVYFKFCLQKIFFKYLSDCLIVESTSVRDELSRIVSSDKIVVIKNTINSILLGSSCIKSPHDGLNVCYVSSYYPHKNFAFFFAVAKALLGTEITFHVTLPDEVFSRYAPTNVVNHGYVKIADLPEFYSKMDVSFFPSELECFSTFPLESFFFGNFVIIADEKFNTIYREFDVISFTPNSLDEVVSVFNSGDFARQSTLESNKKILSSYVESYSRSNEYVRYIKGIS